MPITGTIRKTVDLDHGVQMTPLGQLFASADHNAHTFEVTLTASGKAVDVSGAGVFAYFIRNDQKTVVVTSGKAQRNVVTVTLPESCYVTDRQAAHFQLIIKVSSTPDRKAVFWGDGYITRSTTDAIIDPGHEIPSLEELLAMVAEVEGVTTAARDATSKANTATTQANAARDAANTAASAANTAKANADAATEKANDAATAATTAKTNADAATKAANDAATAANTAKTNADTATKKANDAASAATTATTNANAATKSANDAAAAANTAKTNADSATAKANTAATNADTATGKANTATANANAATTNANNAANLIKNMTVTTTKVAAGGTPTATLTTATNPDRYNLNIGVVTGDTGKTGAKGDTGAAAGFGAITATVDNKVGTPSVEVTKGGPATATTLNFAFHNLKGNTGEIGNITVNGKGPDASGNFTVDIPVTSVNGRTGAVSGVAPALQTSYDLDTYKTGGVWFLNDVPSRYQNYPEGLPNSIRCVLFVEDHPLTGSGNTEIMQILFCNPYAATSKLGRIYIRTTYNDVFTPWTGFYSEGFKPTAADVGARPSTWLPSLSDIGAAAASSLANYVPTTRKVNNKALSADISLTAADVGALPSTTTIPKLYGATGIAADGAMTQKAVTEAIKAATDILESKIPTPLDAYPVGAVYISLVGTSPASLFGGTWAAIEEAFLFATSQHHPEWIGNIGGSATHTLTVSELPPHTHPLMVTLDTETRAGEERNVVVGGGAFWNYDTHPISETGDGSAFSIMPPYFRVYMWQRTA